MPRLRVSRETGKRCSDGKGRARLPDIDNDEVPGVISAEDVRAGEVLKRGNFGDTLVPVFVGAGLLSVVGMGRVAVLSMRGGA